MYTLYGSQGSGSAAIEAAFVRIGQPYRLVCTEPPEPDSAQAELRKLNPLGQVPTLQMPDGQGMTESAAILVHLALEHPAAALLPADSSARAQALRGLVYIAANCYSAIGIIDLPGNWLAAPDAASERQLQRGATQRLHAHWSVFADQFGARLLPADGSPPAALDLLAAVVSRWSGARAHLRQHRPVCFASLLRTDVHPSVAPVFARHFPA